jgi:hypothetical protein
MSLSKSPERNYIDLLVVFQTNTQDALGEISQSLYWHFLIAAATTPVSFSRTDVTKLNVRTAKTRMTHALIS